MAVIVISACLLGYPVRYDGSALAPDGSWLGRVAKGHRLCPFCPETAAGLPTPRPCAEIVGGDGHDVLHGRAEVMDAAGRSLTAAFRAAAGLALDYWREQGAIMAILADKSPSCGRNRIYDGTFSGTRKEGCGVTAALLIESGVAVFSQDQLGDITIFLERSAEGPGASGPWPTSNGRRP